MGLAPVGWMVRGDVLFIVMRLGVVVVDIHYELEASHCGRQSQIWKSDTKLVIHSPVWLSGLNIRKSRGSSQRGTEEASGQIW